MGNTPSSSSNDAPPPPPPPPKSPHSSSSSTASPSPAGRRSSTAFILTRAAAGAGPGGRLGSLSHGTFTPLHPRASAAALLVSSPSTTTTASPVQALATSTSTPPRSAHHHVRSRSSGSPLLLSHDLDLNLSHTHRFLASMGNTDSKPSSHAGSPQHPQHHLPPSRASTLPVRATPPHPKPAAAAKERVSEKPMPLSATPAAQEPAPPSPTSQPVDVPPANHDGQSEKEFPPAGYSQSPYSLAPANYVRPPRLPLPIEEEVHSPGSPIITPQDVANTTILDSTDIEGGVIPRKSSVLSSTTIDDDDVGDNEAFANDAQWGEVRVPTRLEWKGSGDKIFVTGTWCSWERKVKLHRNKDGYFSANVNLRPGTHHVKFLVDGEMQTSPELPTTVDWINILVNYIEVVAPLPADEKQPPAPAEPMPIPGAAATKGQTTGTSDPAAIPLDERNKTQAPETEAGLSSTLQESVGPKGEKLSSTPGQVTASPTPTQKQEPKHGIKSTPKKLLPRPKYTGQIPQFLIDLDNYHNPEDDAYQRAQRVAKTLPAPPSLPMFLSKSILNGATPHKDDASVLIMPNHTVLNHLATSSIRHGVLATSGTTRYKRKFLTTIMYKPTSDDG